MNLSQTTVTELRALIVRGSLEPGATVTEAWVCQEYSVARPTAKSAIDRLVGEGVLQREVNRPARVPALSREQIADLYEARLVVEGAAIESLAAARLVSPALRRVQRVMSVSLDDAAEFIDSDVAFHRALVDAAGSPRLRAMHDLVIGETQLCMARVRSHRLLRPGDVLREHQDLLDIIEQGDASAAVAALKHHILWARDAVTASLDEA